MKARSKWITVVAVAAATVVGVTGAGAFGSAQAPAKSQTTISGGEDLPDVCGARPTRPVQIATAKLIIEFNSTDGDLGVHGAFDDSGWSALCVFDPRGKPIAVFEPRSQLKDLTMAGVFFESREPSLSEFPMKELAAKFPQGQYRVQAKSYDGKILVGSATFTHNVPAPPTITAPALAEDPERPGVPVPRRGLVIDWDPVTKTITGGRVHISGYQVIVTKVNHDDPHGLSRPAYDVHVPANLNALSVPIEFLQPNTVYELEVLALEVSGNQTISLGYFVTN